MGMTMMLMSKVDKIAAWVLLSCFLVYMVSGFDIQLHFLSPRLSALIHMAYLFIIAEIAFVVHTSYAIHLAFKRWKIWNVLGKCLLGIYLVINGYLCYLYTAIHF